MDVGRARHWKVPFEYLASRGAPPAAPGAWADAEGHPGFLGVVERVLGASIDPMDVSAVARLGAAGAARRLIDSEAQWGCAHDAGWWSVLEVGGEAAGFVLPVRYLDPPTLGTIFHLGLVPAARGRGLGRALLRRAATTLIGAGIERIYSDTSVDNAPMIAVFEAEGWTRLDEREVPLPAEYDPQAH